MKLFENIQVQTCSWCNLKCKFCPNSYLDRPREAMDMAVYDRIIQELRDINFSGRFSPFLMNEPLLDNRLPARTALSTNRSLLSRQPEPQWSVPRSPGWAQATTGHSFCPSIQRPLSNRITCKWRSTKARNKNRWRGRSVPEPTIGLRTTPADPEEEAQIELQPILPKGKRR